MRSDGSHQTRVTHDPACDIRPAWSPDGRSIAFNSNSVDGQFDVFRMRADGSRVVNLTPDSPDFNFAPDWQPVR